MSFDLRFALRRFKYLLTKLKYSRNLTIKLGKFVYVGKEVNLSSNISIGDCSYIGQFSYIAPNVHIGNFALFSDNVNIIGHDHKFDVVGTPTILSGLPVEVPTFIGDDVWLGHAVTIMRGVEIGNGSIIASNSVVTKDIPPYEIWAGVPAKKINIRFTPDQIKKHESFLNDFKNGLIELKHDRNLEGIR
ncbi:Streptogramin A acetyltransferase [Shewanella sp. P1-14-1]|uniref:CatB-related O-acetyltransferase n=1 Tax=Shewanella sp. P1-14-1 TaxID=1723761 RepID=UPI0006D65644|nr:CatB-related O-acetyltransferase [Shewanella sp. P1-14-1]KPZ72993.1 Streptogramin A acetyltransferase [Shewanella sp. P1-14-1]